MAFNLNKRSTIDVFSLQLRDPDTDELLFEDAEKKFLLFDYPKK